MVGEVAHAGRRVDPHEELGLLCRETDRVGGEIEVRSEALGQPEYQPTPSTQPLRVTIVRSPEAKARLLPHIFEGNRPKVESGPAAAILAADVDFHENIPRLLRTTPK